MILSNKLSDERQQDADKPDIGVVIPTYNRDKPLRRAIKSAINQTRPPDHIVVVDGGSNFNVRELLPRFDNQLTLIVQDNRQGPSAARNTGFQALDTEYVAFLDSDDYWAQTKLEKQLSVAIEQNLDFVYCDQWIVDEKGTKQPSKKKLYDEDIWERLLDGWMGPNPSSLLIRSETFDNVGGFDTTLTSCEDHDLWMRIAQSGATFGFVPERLSYFTQEADNRLSFTQDIRLPGVHHFLQKWQPVIIRERGRLQYHLFRWDYLMLAYGMCVHEVQKGNYRSAISLFSQYLSTNPVFYSKVCEKVIEKAAPGVRSS